MSDKIILRAYRQPDHSITHQRGGAYRLTGYSPQPLFAAPTPRLSNSFHFHRLHLPDIGNLPSAIEMARYLGSEGFTTCLSVKWLDKASNDFSPAIGSPPRILP